MPGPRLSATRKRKHFRLWPLMFLPLLGLTGGLYVGREQPSLPLGVGRFRSHERDPAGAARRLRRHGHRALRSSWLIASPRGGSRSVPSSSRSRSSPCSWGGHGRLCSERLHGVALSWHVTPFGTESKKPRFYTAASKPGIIIIFLKLAAVGDVLVARRAGSGSPRLPRARRRWVRERSP